MHALRNQMHDNALELSSGFCSFNNVLGHTDGFHGLYFSANAHAPKDSGRPWMQEFLSNCMFGQCSLAVNLFAPQLTCRLMDAQLINV